MEKYKAIQNQLTYAIKEQDEIAKTVWRSAIDAIQKAAIEKKCKDNISDELIDEVLLKEKKILQERIDCCPLDRLEMREMFGAQMIELNRFVPRLLDDPEEIRAIIIGELAAAGIELVKSNKGAVMKTIVPILKGKADMKVVNQVVSEELL